MKKINLDSHLSIIYHFLVSGDMIGESKKSSHKNQIS